MLLPKAQATTSPAGLKQGGTLCNSAETAWVVICCLCNDGGGGNGDGAGALVDGVDDVGCGEVDLVVAGGEDAALFFLVALLAAAAISGKGQCRENSLL